MRKIEIRCGDVSETLCIEEFGSGKPVVAITGGVHGNESIGAETAKKLIGLLPENCGTVRIIAECNPGALRAGKRAHPADGMDMNRAFPGDATGTITQCLAAEIWRETADADFLIDLHGSAPGNLPYILSVYDEGDALREMARRIPLPFVVLSAGTEGQLFVEACRRRGQCALVLELPSDGNSSAFAQKVKDFLEGRPCPTPVFCGRLKRISLVAGRSFRRVKCPGETAEAGETIAFVDETPILMPEKGMLVGIRPEGLFLERDRWAGSYVVPN